MLNPGRRKRYVLHEGELELQSVAETIEKINGGDARFIRLGDDLPELAAFWKKKKCIRLIVKYF